MPHISTLFVRLGYRRSYHNPSEPYWRPACACVYRDISLTDNDRF